MAHLHHQQPLKIHHKTAEEGDEVPWEEPHTETSARELEETLRAVTFSNKEAWLSLWMQHLWAAPYQGPGDTGT